MERIVQTPGRAHGDTGLVPGGGERPPGSRGSDGGPVGAPGGGLGPVGPRFDQPVPPGGYCWWYVDALSDDGRHGLSIIAFVGSVFSPYYFWSNYRDPENHCAINVALYGAGFCRWSMTERPGTAVMRSPDRFVVGASSLATDGSGLTIDVDEVSVPFPRPLRGRIRLHPAATASRAFALDGAGRHRWMPIAPKARVEVALTHPALSWSGHGYWDTNAGDEPVARAFRCWDWSRADLRDGAAVLYDTTGIDGSERVIAVRYDATGACRDFEPPPRVALPRTRWRVPRRTLAEPGADVTVLRTLEDTPFYARSVLSTRLCGEQVAAVHESLSVERFDRTLTRLMLPWRMPRQVWPR